MEFDFVALLNKRWTIDGGITYLDASYQDFTNANCYAHQSPQEGCINLAGGNVQDLSGETLSNAPQRKTYIGTRYSRTFSSHNGYLQLNLRAQSEVNLDVAGNPGALQSGYGIVDFHLGFDSRDGRYGAKLFVMNVFDKQYINGISINGNAGGDLLLQLLPRDFYRYSGGSFTLNF